MAHRYGQPIQMRLTAGEPSAFVWRGVRYRIMETLSTWRLRDRWWEAAAGGGASDRHYYRVRCAGEQFFDVYYDAATDCWVMDRAHD
jgi:hypothetical protein